MGGSPKYRIWMSNEFRRFPEARSHQGRSSNNRRAQVGGGEQRPVRGRGARGSGEGGGEGLCAQGALWRLDR